MKSRKTPGTHALFILELILLLICSSKLQTHLDVEERREGLQCQQTSDKPPEKDIDSTPKNSTSPSDTAQNLSTPPMRKKRTKDQELFKKPKRFRLMQSDTKLPVSSTQVCGKSAATKIVATETRAAKRSKRDRHTVTPCQHTRVEKSRKRNRLTVAPSHRTPSAKSRKRDRRTQFSNEKAMNRHTPNSRNLGILNTPPPKKSRKRHDQSHSVNAREHAHTRTRTPKPAKRTDDDDELTHETVTKSSSNSSSRTPKSRKKTNPWKGTRKPTPLSKWQREQMERAQKTEYARKNREMDEAGSRNLLIRGDDRQGAL